jgi:hypothetical protein
MQEMPCKFFFILQLQKMVAVTIQTAGGSYKQQSKTLDMADLVH